MRATVDYAGKTVGWLLWTPDAYGVQVEIDCDVPPGAPLLRCYGEMSGAPLRIGLPAPENGRLRLQRHLSKETLKAAGCVDGPPTIFYLAEHPRQPDKPRSDTEVLRKQPQSTPSSPASKPRLPRTGDAVLDALLEDGGVRAERIPEGVRLRCPFASDRPFALAPAFVLCRVEGDEAILDWTKKDAAGMAASEKTAEIT